MPTNKLTDHAIKSAKPKDRAYKLTDGGGLYLFITTSGAKSWRLAYRLAGAQKTLTLGLYPAVLLADARKKRDEAKRALAAGDNPGAPRVKKTPSLADFYAKYWAGRGDVGERYRAAAISSFKNHIEKPLGHRQIGAIARDDLLPVLLEIDKAGNSEAARKSRTYLALAWAQAVEHGLCAVNIPQQISPKRAFSRQAVEHFPSVTLAETPALWERLHLEQHRISGLACKMLALTWTRTAEVRGMRWDEVDGDLWRIPGARMKRGKDHLVPLSTQALAVLDLLRPTTRGAMVFPSDRGADKQISENTILSLLYEMGYRGRMTGHGWRTIASTWANESGYNRDAIERQLAHSPDDKVRAAYNRAEFMQLRAPMLQAWADWLDSSLPLQPAT